MGRSDRVGGRGWVRWAIQVGLALIIVYFVGTFVQVWTATRWDDRSRSDAIVVLGAAQYNGKPSPALRGRLDHAHELWTAKVAPMIVLTGSKQSGDRFTEAYAGFEYLRELGVPENALLVVDDGTSTWESMAAAARALRVRGFSRATLVSDPFHSFRLVGTADEVGLTAEVSPTDASVSFGQVAREWMIVSVGRIIGYQRVVRWFE